MLDVELYKEDFSRRKQLAKLIDRYYKELHSDKYISDIDKCLRFIDTQYRNGKEIWILTDDDKPIGYGIICINNEYGMLEDSVEQEYLYVKKKYRKGIGASMLLRITLRGCVHYGLDATAPTYIDGEANKIAKSLGMTSDIEYVYMDKDKAKDCVNRLDRLIERRSKNVIKE